ncbi:hypothetical protein [uncultured Cohaesibacter sp.]|uniref:hypothetical protein n=1 Tax=uncultured Cohaesibacter sp. TaxID=1002546 RepID=UPI0029C8BB6D|nr:hypothetical protein [uncultured Cohaesibacter sp.]
MIIRYLGDSELAQVRRRRWRKVFYVIDDDLMRLDDDRSVPEDYRQRLLAFRQKRLPDILDLADVIVAPNERILEGYPSKKGERLDPCYVTVCDDLRHFDDYQTIRILFPGSRSHLNDLAFLQEGLLRLSAAHTELEIVTYMGANAPVRLKGMEQIQHRKPLPWAAFQKEQQRERFHICLMPTVATPFNQARSINKLFDCAAVGAVGVFSRGGPTDGVIADGVDGLLVDHDVMAWEKAVGFLIDDMARAKTMAQACLDKAGLCGNPVRVRDFWRKQLDI